MAVAGDVVSTSAINSELCPLWIRSGSRCLSEFSFWRSSEQVAKQTSRDKDKIVLG